MKTMTLSGQSGRLNLKDFVVEFGNWNINTNIERGRPTRSGNFEIQESDRGVLFNDLMGKTINADFYGNENYNGEIIIKKLPFDSTGASITVLFEWTGPM